MSDEYVEDQMRRLAFREEVKRQQRERRREKFKLGAQIAGVVAGVVLLGVVMDTADGGVDDNDGGSDRTECMGNMAANEPDGGLIVSPQEYADYENACIDGGY